ncbi:MAG: DUF4185 domain-containing protein [Pseudomonadota bacterium]
MLPKIHRVDFRDIIKRSSWLALLMLSIFFFSLSPSISSDCIPCFPYKDGWYGGDAAYSIRLDEKRTLWLFGDTFVSDEQGRQDRIDMDVVLGTTPAISTCSEDGKFEIQYYLKKTNEKFTSSFGENEWLWPQDPFIFNSTLYIPLIAVETKPEMEGPFKFKIAGHKIARITDFEAADPNRWIVDYIDLSPGIPEGIIAFATTSIVHQNHVYFYPFYASTNDIPLIYGNILARIPIKELKDPANAIEYFTKDGTWEKGLNPAKVKIVIAAGVSELSVRYHADDKKWLAVYMSARNNGDQLLYQVADRPEGSWSEPKTLIRTIPEVDPESTRYDKNNFCYAGKEHIEFTQGKNLVVTYVCNSFEDFQKNTNFIRKNLFLYRPVVRILKYHQE